MKIQCDVCSIDEASVFCSADEAALCNACDHRVHHANKLASKHRRFSLLRPSPKQFPLCDICQEKRAFLFCRQDRAILCRDCDVPIHKANDHTRKHNRFLLTGIKLSPTSDVYMPTGYSLTNGCDSTVPVHKSQPYTTKKTVSDSSQIYHPPSMETTSTTVSNPSDVGPTSSISEYLMEMLPGWHVEDFLDSSSAPYGFCKSDNGVLPFLDAGFESNLNSFSSDNVGVWVPQAPSILQTQDCEQHCSYLTGNYGSQEATSMKVANKRWCDDGFTVPQISPPSTTGPKKSRVVW